MVTDIQTSKALCVLFKRTPEAYGVKSADMKRNTEGVVFALSTVNRIGGFQGSESEARFLSLGSTEACPSLDPQPQAL